MKIMQVSQKGQVVIPREIREKYGIVPGSNIEIIERNGQILIIPIPEDPIKSLRGILKGWKSTKEILDEVRAEERSLEARRIGNEENGA